MKVLSLLEAGLSLERATYVCRSTSVFLSLTFVSRWVSSQNCRSWLANTDPENVSCLSYLSLTFFIFSFSDGTPQALRRRINIPKVSLYLALL